MPDEPLSPEEKISREWDRRILYAAIEGVSEEDLRKWTWRLSIEGKWMTVAEWKKMVDERAADT